MIEFGKSLLRALKSQARPAITLFLILTILTGVVYPILVTGTAQILFPHQANGSPVVQNGVEVGSDLIGQPFSDPRYFWGRLSATPSFPYNASLSSGTNYGPNNPALLAMVQSRIDALHAVDPNNTQPIPSDLVTASSSGLDPDISVASALYQAPRVARERNISEAAVLNLVNQSIVGRQLGVLGERTVNVLDLNLALDKLQAPSNGSSTYIPPEPADERVLGMTTSDWFYIGLLLVALMVAAWFVGKILTDAYDERPGRVTRSLKRVESYINRPSHVKEEGMDWKMYAFALLLFNLIGILVLMVIMIVQPYLPLNPQHLGSVSPDLAFNTAVSFATNTNWQSYAGETTMSYFTQMVGLTVQNFLSAATGLAVMMALIRGIRQRTTKNLGNFWKDMTRATLILLPLAFLLSLFLVSQGVPQTLDGPMSVHLVQPVMDSTSNLVSVQTIPVGPVASQEAIKLLGTNGGGFFNANSAHPFENPTALSNLVETLALLVIPVGVCFTFGSMVKDRRQGFALLVAMMLIFLVLLGVAIWAEEGGNPSFANQGVSQIATENQPGGNMEGKEVRFGVVPSCLFAVATTSTSCGAVDSMHDSYTPLGGLVPLFAIQLGEVVFGGVGSGLYGMLVFVLIAVFIAGLMIGRMPDYLGKKIGPYEMKLCTIIILLPIVVLLIGTAIAVMLPDGRAGVLNPGPHGFTEILYAFSSAVGNNGSAFAGLTANTLFYNVILGIAMLLGRYPIAVLTLALAGALSAKKIVPASSGSLPTHTPLFISWLIGVIVLLGALSFFLSLALGPIVEFLMSGG
ncbi:MAG: potassium-transporting ATPase subunit KdpA [Methanomassiliicoccales archaeon]|jgi:K+-transporting ATPase ATPase A chain